MAKKLSVAASFLTMPADKENTTSPLPSSFQPVFPVPSSDSTGALIVDLPLSKVHFYKGYPELAEDYPFASQPYKVIEDSPNFIELMASMEDMGQLEPGLVRPDPEGGYEIVAGHRRYRIQEILKQPTFRCEIRNLSDEEAAKIINDSNIYRDELLPSEKAWAYRLKYEAAKRQGARTDITSRQNGAKLGESDADLTSRQNGAKSSKDDADLTSRHFGTKLAAYRADKELATKVKDSARTIQRYIQLTRLTPQLLDLVDRKKIKLDAAEQLSFIKDSEQKDLFDYVSLQQEYPSKDQAIAMRQASEKGELNLTVISLCMKSSKQESTKAFIKLEELDSYWHSKTPKQAENELICLANAVPKLRQYTALFPENLSTEAFMQKLMDLTERVNRQRMERQPPTR